MAHTIQRPPFEVLVTAGGLIEITQTDGVADDRPVIAIHPHDVEQLVEKLLSAQRDVLAEK